MVINRFICKVINRYILAHKNILVISIEWNAGKRYPPTAYHVIICVIMTYPNNYVYVTDTLVTFPNQSLLFKNFGTEQDLNLRPLVY